MKTVLVTGSSGFWGRHLVKRLNELNYYVITFAHKECDLLDGDNCDFLLEHNPNYIIHAAGNCGGLPYNKANPYTLFYDNMKMGLNLIDACVHKMQTSTWKLVKFVSFGTICMYPKFPKHVPFVEDDLFYGHPEETNAPYALAKQGVMIAGNAARQQYSLPFITVMPTNTYGPCFHKNTLIMTPDGPKNVKDFSIGDRVYTLNPSNHKIEVSKVIATQNYKTNSWFNFTSYGIKFKVTPDHNIYFKQQGKKYRKERADFFESKMGSHGQLYLAKHNPVENPILDKYLIFNMENYISNHEIIDKKNKFVRDCNHSHSGKYFYVHKMKDFVKLLGWFIAEGCVTGDYQQIRISQSLSANLQNIYKIGNLLNRMKIPHGYDGRSFYFTSNLWENYFNSEIGKYSENKRIPKFIFNEDFPYEYRLDLFNAMMAGDGNKNGRRYTTKSSILKDDFCHLCMLLGKSFNASFDEDSQCWRISVRSKKITRTIKFKNITKEIVDNEECYCITAENNHIVYATLDSAYGWIGQCDCVDLERSHIIGAALTKIRNATIHSSYSPPTFFGDGKATRDFLYVEDGVEAVIKAMENYDSPDPLNIGSGRETTIKEIVELIANQMQYSGYIKWTGDSSMNGQPRRVLNIDRVRKALEWEPKTSLEDGIKNTVEWFLGEYS